MKIPFDIKFRQQIESGKYKVQTTDGRDVRIICWDKRVYGGRYEIVALVPIEQGDTETCQMYNPDGSLIASTWNEKYKLVILTDEPELTPFENRLCEILDYAWSGKDSVKSDNDIIHDAKMLSYELLDLAKKELCGGCTKCIDEYWRGRKEAMDEMSRGYHYEGPAIPVYFPPCYHGGPCTNPMHDCVNCPRQSTGGFNTTTGTSASKVEG